MMEYKGYAGKVEFDDEAGIFHGEVLDTRDVITFQGSSVAELHKAFQESIDDYLAFCKRARGGAEQAVFGPVRHPHSARPAPRGQSGGKHVRQEPECVGFGATSRSCRPGKITEARESNNKR